MLRHIVRRPAFLHGRRLCSVSEGGSLERDSIQLKGLVFHGYHGVLPEENILGQKFVVDATIFSNLKHAGITDDLNNTLDYARVYDTIKNIVEGKPYNLVEALAENIATSILEEDMVDSVRVKIQKPHVAVTGIVESLGVEIYRTKDMAPKKQRIFAGSS